MRVYGRKREFPLRRPHELRWQISIKMEGWTLPRRAITLLATSLQITLRFWCSIIASARRVGTWYVLHSLGYRHLAGRGSECKHARLAIAPTDHRTVPRTPAACLAAPELVNILADQVAFNSVTGDKG